MGAEDTNAVVEDVATGVDVSADVDTEVDTEVETEPEITHETFGWDDWDGDHTALPETVRGWAERLGRYYEQPVLAAREEAERTRRIFEALSEGQDDPRLAELQKQLEEREGGWKTEREQYESRVAEHEAKLKAFEEYHEAQAEARVNEFVEQHKWMFDDGPIEKMAGDMLHTHKFDHKDLPVLLRMPERVRTRACELMKELGGNPNLGKHAIKLAKAEYSAPEPLPSEKLVSNPSITATPAEHALSANPSLQEFRDSAIDRALRLHSR